MPNCFARWNLSSQILLRLYQYDGMSERKMKNLAICSKMVVEDTTMMASTAPNFTRPLFGCNEGVVQFGSVTAKYLMCGNNRPMGVLVLWWEMKRISLASMHDPICVGNGREENTLKYSYLQIMVWLSPCHLRSGAPPTQLSVGLSVDGDTMARVTIETNAARRQWELSQMIT